MKEYISHFSAALQWNIPNLDDLFGEKHMNKYREGEVVDITVVDPSMRCRKKGFVSHTCRKPLPRGAVIKCSVGFVASPELIFLELATVEDIHKMILLGLQMCSHPPGKASAAVTTKRKLELFLAKTSGHYGHKMAKRAVRYIEDGSASLMESISFMVFTLPYSLGGFGLNNASFNYEVSLKTETRLQMKQTRCYVDLYFKKKKLAVEYDSFTHHSTPSAQAKDLLRETALENMGVDVLRFSTLQLYNEKECIKFIHNLASRLGKRIKIQSPKFPVIHEELRKLLPSKS